jgi:hypothetical protein
MLARVVTKPILRFMLIGMPVAMCLLAVISVDSFTMQRIPFAPYITIEVACFVLLTVGMFVGALALMLSARTTIPRGLFGIATRVERAVWIGGAVLALVVSSSFLYFNGSDWARAFEPMMICAIALPSVALISAARRLGQARAA